ncbi:MAG: DinB family protein [Flavobacteriales bacterium]|jgi:uncharacterized damage-inducible protein DinB
MIEIDQLISFPSSLGQTLENLPKSLLLERPDQKWSIQTHAGHLLTMESLWIGRLDDFFLERPTLRPWNGTNADTDAAQFDLQNITQILDDFASIRLAHLNMIKENLSLLSPRSCLHERSGKQLTFQDHLKWIVNHDQEHLKIINDRIKAWKQQV